MKKMMLIAFFAASAANAGTPVKSEFFYHAPACCVTAIGWTICISTCWTSRLPPRALAGLLPM